MAMTKLERRAKEQIMKKLFEDGYGSNANTGDKITYSQLFDYFDLNLTADPDTVAYCEMGNARIVVNENLDIDQVSFIIRHEILHEFLDHFIRIKRHIMRKQGVNSEEEIDWNKEDHELQNMAADWELSNRGYTDKDKRIAKNIRLNGKTLKGLVTEIDRPEWVDLSMEEMYEKLTEENEEFKQALSQMLKNNPQLDKPGNQDIQDLEGVKRTAQSLDEMADDLEQQAQQNQQQDQDQDDQSNDSKAEAQQLRDKAKRLKDLADKLADAADDAKDEIKDKIKEELNDPIRTPSEVKADADLQKRVENLKKLAKEGKAKKDLEQKLSKDLSADEMKRAKKEAQKYKRDPLTNFKLTLAQLIKEQLSTGRGNTWKKFNKTYANTSLIKPGRTHQAQKYIPLFQVYFDQSGSWDDEDIEYGKRAIAAVNEYVRKGQIEMHLYYFSNNVHSNAADARSEGGTEGQPILDHIKKTQPTNVIILTDSDISDCVSEAAVPGGVFLLFRDGKESSNLIDHIGGARLTRIFDI